jgi:hypothetical protein
MLVIVCNNRPQGEYFVMDHFPYLRTRNDIYYVTNVETLQRTRGLELASTQIIWVSEPEKDREEINAFLQSRIR